MTGGGTRARHVYNIGVDLGMPTGVLSKLGDKDICQQKLIRRRKGSNARGAGKPSVTFSRPFCLGLT